MERNERLKAADKCASRYTDKNVARIARSSFMLGCEFEAQGEAIKGVNLSTLEETEIPNDLEEAAAQYARDYTENDEGNGGDDWEDDIRITFKAGAKWQAEQYHFFNKAWAENMQAELDRNYENGKQAMKEQMMKEAVEGKVCGINGNWVESEYLKNPVGEEGDKVKLIIIKED